MSWVDNSFFAPESLLDDQGRRIMWSWIFDSPGFAMRQDFGWSGTMSLPRVLSLGPDGMLRMNPAGRDRTAPLSSAKPDEPGGRGRQGTGPRRHPRQQHRAGSGDSRRPRPGSSASRSAARRGGEEETLVYYDATDKKLKVDTNKSSLTEGPQDARGRPLRVGGRMSRSAPRLRGQVRCRSLRQRPPGGDAARLSRRARTASGSPCSPGAAPHKLETFTSGT